MSVFQPRAESRPAPPPTFREARDLLFELADSYNAAKTSFVWPRPERFNWALDWFDAELAAGEHGAKTALKVLGEPRRDADLRRALVGSPAGSPTACARSARGAATGS